MPDSDLFYSTVGVALVGGVALCVGTTFFLTTMYRDYRTLRDKIRMEADNLNFQENQARTLYESHKIKWKQWRQSNPDSSSSTPPEPPSFDSQISTLTQESVFSSPHDILRHLEQRKEALKAWEEKMKSWICDPVNVEPAAVLPPPAPTTIPVGPILYEDYVPYYEHYRYLDTEIYHYDYSGMGTVYHLNYGPYTLFNVREWHFGLFADSIFPIVTIAGIVIVVTYFHFRNRRQFPRQLRFF